VTWPGRSSAFAVSRRFLVAILASSGFSGSFTVAAQALSTDGVLLVKLAKSGSDLSKLHKVDFHLHFPTQEAAESAASQLAELAFATEIEGSDSGDEWKVLASKRMFPVERDLMGLRDKLNAIAEAEHGKYDGWQARVAE
jgi:regulator of RNase E activity RraB